MTGNGKYGINVMGFLFSMIILLGTLNERCQIVQAAETLPVSYSCKEAGKDPEVKSQGTLSTCWALTATSALEAALLPDVREVLSADHMSLSNAFLSDQKQGGDYKMIMAYLAGWQGPVLETEDPYGDGETNHEAAAVCHVQEILYLETPDREKLKEMLRDSGPIQTSLYMDRAATDSSDEWYNRETSAYFYDVEKKSNHDVLLVGWDDTYPAENFAHAPSEDGAWICQNTWGSEFGENGLFYVSYEDPNIAETALAFTDVEGTDNYDHIYQTDPCGWQGNQGYKRENCFFANVYTAKNDEKLAAAGFYTLGDESHYCVYLVHDFCGQDSFGERKLLAEGDLDGTGYHTVKLLEPEELRAGERFAVVVELRTPGITTPVAVEVCKDRYTVTVSTQGKEGYLSLTGERWENTEEKYETNVCLKAYTVNKED